MNTISNPMFPAGMALTLLPTECACTAARRAARAITQLYDSVLQPSGLKATQYILLSIIVDKGEISQHDLSQLQAVAVETLSRRLAVLRRAGLVEMRVGDKSQRIYSATEFGRQSLAKVMPLWVRAQQRLMAASGQPSLNQWLELCDQMTGWAQKALVMRVRNT